jgi:hypothetical protein
MAVRAVSTDIPAAVEKERKSGQSAEVEPGEKRDAWKYSRVFWPAVTRF